MRFSAILLLAEAVSAVVINSNTIVSADYPTADITVNLGVFYTIINPVGQFTGSLNIAGELFFVAAGLTYAGQGFLFQLGSLSNTGTTVFNNLANSKPIAIAVNSALFLNSGFMFMVADTSAPGTHAYSIGSTGNWQNSGTIVVSGSSTVVQSTFVVAASPFAENSGAICLNNAVFYPGLVNVNGGGCINVGAGGQLNIDDGSLFTQTIYMSDRTSVVSITPTSNACKFSIGGFTGTNSIYIQGNNPVVFVQPYNFATVLTVSTSSLSCTFSLLGVYQGPFTIRGSSLIFWGIPPHLPSHRLAHVLVPFLYLQML